MSSLKKKDRSQPESHHSGEAVFGIGRDDGLPEKVLGMGSRPSGPVLLDVSGQAAFVRATVSHVVPAPTLRVFTRSKQASVIKAVKDTQVAMNGNVLTVTIPGYSVGPTVIQGGGVYISGNAGFVSVGRGSTTVISGGLGNDSVQVEAVLPLGSSVRSALGSGDIEVTGDLVDLDADSSSGDIKTDGDVSRARIRTSSGDVLLVTSASRAEIRTSSGDVKIGHLTEAAEIETSTGDIWIGEHLGSSVNARTSSGDVLLRVAREASGSLVIRTSSGDITLNGVRGRDGAKDPEGDLDIKIRTSSGEINRR